MNLSLVCVLLQHKDITYCDFPVFEYYDGNDICTIVLDQSCLVGQVYINGVRVG